MAPAADASDVLVNAIEDGSTLRLFGRRGVYDVAAFDGFYLSLGDAKKLPPSWRKLIGPVDRQHVRVRWPEPARGGAKKRLEAWEPKFRRMGVRPLEADVSPIDRYLADHPKLVLESQWRCLYIDVETTRVPDWGRPWEGTRILSFSWSSPTRGTRGHVRLPALNDPAERALLETFERLVSRHDVVLAWNGKAFDFRVLTGRMDALGIEHEPRHTHWLDHLKIFKRYFTVSEDGAVKQSFKLDAVGQALLGEAKVPLERRAKDRGWKRTQHDLILWCWQSAPDLLREYNDQDVRLMELIEAKTGFVALHFGLCRLCHVLPTARSIYPMTLIDGRMLRVGHEVGYRFPTRAIGGESDQPRVRGAFVPPARVGLHHSVAVLDYARMYPSIILAANLSLETLDPAGDVRVPKTDEDGTLLAGAIARFRSQPEGHLPAALRAVLEERKRYSAAKSAAPVESPAWYDAGRLSTACKVLANSFYGVFLSPMSRYYSPELGGSVTSIGRLLLARTIAELRRRGHSLVFGDTDSVAFPATDEQAAAIRDAMNAEVLPELLSGFGARIGDVRIEYEKRFRTVVVTASKRYAGRFAVFDGKPIEHPKLDVRGLEMRRSDVCQAARTLQRILVEQVVDGAEPKALWDQVRTFRDQFEAGQTSAEDLMLRKGISKRPDEYAEKNKPQHVRLAEAMIARGYEVEVGSKIQFVLTTRGPMLPDDAIDVPLDLRAYWNEHVYPPSERVLDSAWPEIAWQGLRFPKGYQPGQASLLEFEGPRPKRPIRMIQLEVDARDVDVVALRELFDRFAGPHAVQIIVRDAGAKTELALDQKIADPAETPDLRAALALLQVRADWATTVRAVEGT